MFFFQLLARIPFSFLYIVSDFFAFITGPVLGYRRKVIHKNLKNSFPDMSRREIWRTSWPIYKNFMDVFIETFKLLIIPREDLIKRTVIKNLELLNDRLRKGQSVIVLTSHYCNWEWMLATCSIQLIYPPDGVYLRVTSPFFEKLMLKIRSRFGAYMIEKKHILSEEYKRNHLTRVIAMVSDQAPRGERSMNWVTFLNQDTPFINGPERIAKILKLPVIYGKMRRVKRGYYEIEFVEIETVPEKSAKNFITEKFASYLEQTILENPPDWLWTHNRWKQTRSQKQETVKA